MYTEKGEYILKASEGVSGDVGRPILYRNSGSPEEVYDFYVIDEGSVYALDIRKGLPGPFTGCGTGIPLIP